MSLSSALAQPTSKRVRLRTLAAKPATNTMMISTSTVSQPSARATPLSNRFSFSIIATLPFCMHQLRSDALLAPLRSAGCCRAPNARVARVLPKSLALFRALREGETHFPRVVTNLCLVVEILVDLLEQALGRAASEL